MKEKNDWRKAGFSSPAAYRDAEFALDIVAVMGVGVIAASIICLGGWFLGWI